MKHWVRIALLVLASMGLYACKIPFTGPGSMDLTVRGVELDDVLAIYLIVCDEAELADLENPKSIHKVALSERSPKYVTFGQFRAMLDKTWKLEPQQLKPSHQMVTVKVAKKKPNLEVEIDREILESRPSLAVAVVVSTRSHGWGSSEVITSSQIRSIDDLELDLIGTAINVHEKSSGSKLMQIETPR